METRAFQPSSRHSPTLLTSLPMSEPEITRKDLDNLKEQLENVHRDKDRIRLAADNFRFKAAHVVEVADILSFGDAKNQAAILMHPQLIDPDNFDDVLACYQFEEDKQEIRDACGV